MTDATRLNASVSHISMMHRPFGPRVHMDEAAVGGAPASGGAAAATAPAAMPESFSSVADAARFLTAERSRKDQAGGTDPAGAEHTPEPGADTGDAGEIELSDEGNAAPGENPAPGEDEGADPAGDQPPITRPKSWAKDEQAEWDGLPRSLQEKIAAREASRERAIRTSQNDAANQLKGLTAKEQAAEQARNAYEQNARDAFEVLAREQQREFSDIKTVEDVSRLAQTDPLRYIQWNAHQTQLAAMKNAVDEADRRKASEDANAWKTFRQAENAKAIEHIPELGDAAKAPKLMEKAVSILQEVGFSPEELGKYDSGEKLSLFDHRFQRVLFDAIRYRDLQSARSAVVNKPVPQVQRPGVKAPQGNANSERIQALSSKFNASGSLKDAAALLAAQRRATSRRAG